jgi:hypothetical protein
MPWKNAKQPIAIFLDIRRRQGEHAAKQFAEKHQSEMSRGAQAAHGKRPYKARSARSK